MVQKPMDVPTPIADQAISLHILPFRIQVLTQGRIEMRLASMKRLMGTDHAFQRLTKQLDRFGLRFERHTMWGRRPLQEHANPCEESPELARRRPFDQQMGKNFVAGSAGASPYLVERFQRENSRAKVGRTSR